MTDRELLELAAKAAGIMNLQWESDGTIQNRMNRPTIPYEYHGLSSAVDWNPLEDDGDALRLAVTLKLELGFPREAIVWSFGRKGEVCSENYSKDLYSATRRAIVRAAAEIGKGMK